MPVSTLNTDLLTASLGKPVALAYGRHVVSGNVILKDESSLEQTKVFVALGEGEWDGIDELYVNGSPVDLAAGAIHFHKGIHGQLSSGGGLQPEGTGSPYPFTTAGDQKADAYTPDGVQGLTFSRTVYLALSIPFDVFAPSAALDVRGVFRTRKVRIFDAAGVQTGYAYSENPAWQIADLLTVVRGLPDSRIDWASFKAAADYCDQTISINGNDVPRFVSHVAFVDEVDFDEALLALLQTCRGALLDTAGSIRLRIDQPRGAAFDFTMDNIVEGTFAATYKDTREAANRLEMVFRDVENNFAVTTKLWNHEPQQARTGRVITARLYLGNMAQHQAERIGDYLLTRSIDNNLYCTFRATAVSLAVMPGDVVRVRHDAAPWSQESVGASRFESFEVLEVEERPDETREFLCRIYNAASYPDTAGPTQNLIGTTVNRRPPPPPPPDIWGLSANLGGELKLRFSIPQNADYRVGELTLLADEEVNRVSTSLAAALGTADTELTVASSTGFVVGDYVSVGLEILRISGPGLAGSPPTSTVWSVARAQLSTTAASVASGAAVYRLTNQRLHFVLPPGYTLSHPTLDLANGEYYRATFRPGRLRILHASLTFTSLGGVSAPVESTYAVMGAFEPNVTGSLPGLRTSSGGRIELQVPGPLATGTDLVQPVYFPDALGVGVVYATVEKAPTGAPLRLQLTLDGEPFGPACEIAAGASGEPAGSGVFFSGAQHGSVAGARLGLQILQVGSEDPGEDLTVHLTV